MRLGVVSVAALAVLVGGAALGHAGARTQSCTPGTRTVPDAFGAFIVRTYCGPARATVREGRNRKVITGGRCIRTRRSFQIDVGTHTQWGNPSHYWYFGARLSPALADASYVNQRVEVQTAGEHSVRLTVTIVLMAGRTRGSFATGPPIGGPYEINIHGTFTCG
jgi:hypothetical protein